MEEPLHPAYARGLPARNRLTDARDAVYGLLDGLPMHKRIAVAGLYSKLRTLAGIMQLFDAGHEARQRNKRRRSAQQVQAGLRMYAHYINEERLTHAGHPPNYPILSLRRKAACQDRTPPPNRIMDETNFSL